MQIHELSALSGNPASGTSFVVDNGSTTRKIDYTALAKAIIEQYNGSTIGGSTQTLQTAINNLSNIVGNRAGFHNSIYRGKSLGSAFTTAQSNAIQNNTFDDLFVGDYWVINGINWRIADFDTYYGTGLNNPSKRIHHIVVVPDLPLYSDKYNDSNDTINSTGYINSRVRQNIKAEIGTNSGAEQIFINAFGDEHVLPYTAEYPSAYDENGIATNFAFVETRVELMSETAMYGYPAFSSRGLGYEIGTDIKQFSIFNFFPTYKSQGNNTWLRNVRSNTNACYINSNGNCSAAGCSNTYGVRPFALIA